MLFSKELGEIKEATRTVEVLKENIDQLNENNLQDKTKAKQLLINLYYLTGYILECSIKYGIYKVISFDPNSEIESLSTNSVSYSDIKYHRFSRYSDYLVSKSPGIKLVDDKRNINSDIIYLYNNWDAPVRYWYKSIDDSMNRKLNKNNLFEFFNYAKHAFNHIARL